MRGCSSSTLTPPPSRYISSCAVAIAPTGYTPPAHLSRIGVGCDGSPESVVALAAARRLAIGTTAIVKPVRVLPMQSIPYGESVQHRWSDFAKELSEEDRAHIGGVEDLEGQVRYGRPGDELAAFSEEVDLIVVGSRGMGGIGGLLSGSTSRYLARHAHCPLLVFPRTAVAVRVST
jgi:nucleotide-binding universal stress UspA family protein